MRWEFRVEPGSRTRILDNMASCGYIGHVKNKLSHGTRGIKGGRVAEAAGVYGAPLQINVRAAKDRLSNLLNLAAQGEEVVITSDGRPKAKLIAYCTRKKRFKVDWAWLKSMPIRAGGKTSEEIIREDRDGRS